MAMEVEEGETSYVTSGGSGGSVSVSLHPLVIMNISDHFTRVRVQQQDEGRVPLVYGVLLGTQKGRNIEICNSFELVVSDDRELDKDYFTAKEEQFKQVFSTMEFLGWYTIGGSPTRDDVTFHEQICSDSENGLLLKLSPVARTNQLPLSLFESLIEIVDGRPTVMFTPVSYTLATEEAERIGVDHVARSSVSGTTLTSAVAEQLSAQHGAVKMLHSRVRLLLDYLKAVEAGELPRNHEILRKVSSLCHQLPVLDGTVFQKEFHRQTNDVMLMSYLAAITKGLATTSEFVQKVNTIYDRHGLGRRTRSLLY
jgi:COP9 signalosome complex subunit 6